MRGETNMGKRCGPQGGKRGEKIACLIKDGVACYFRKCNVLKKMANGDSRMKGVIKMGFKYFSTTIYP